MKSKSRYVIQKDKESILKGAINSLAVRLAAKAGDPLYDEYVKCKQRLEEIRMKIRQKYGKYAYRTIVNKTK
jgi:hypothetical protein